MNIILLRDFFGIKINNQIKYLSKASPYNQTEEINYLLANQEQNKLTISFEPGEYNLSDFEIYVLDSANIDKAIKNFDKLIINPITKKDELLNGKINVIKDSYFTLTIPYDKGFKIYLNNQQIKYEKVNNKYIGFPIPSGTNTIKVKYSAPGKNISIVLSIIGFITFGTIVFLESKRKF